MPPATIVQGRRERLLSASEIELLKRTVAKGCTDDEFAQFLWVSRKHKVDPFTRQIHAVKFWLNRHHEEKKIGAGGGEITVWVGGYQMVIIMGIDGYRSIAARHHKDYGGCDEPVFTWQHPGKTAAETVTKYTPSGKPIPATCTMKLWKKGFDHSIMATVRWDEFAPPLDELRGDFWNRMPCHMLSKVAESHALRKGYPDLADIYTEEEMAAKLADYTPEGRLLVESDGRTPSGEPAARGVLTHRSAQSVIDAEIERQKRGETPSTVQDLKNGTPGASPEAKAGGGGAGPPSPAGLPKPKGEVLLDWTQKKAPTLRGDLAEILPNLQANIKLTWGEDSWWHFPAEEAPKLRELVKALGYACNDVFPATTRGVPVPASSETHIPAKDIPGKDTRRKKTEPKPNTLIMGTIVRINPSITTQGGACRQVRIGNTWYGCFRDSIHTFLDQGVGKEAEVWINERKNIVGIKRIASRQFEDDGKTPIVQKDEPRGGNLFD